MTPTCAHNLWQQLAELTDAGCAVTLRQGECEIVCQNTGVRGRDEKLDDAFADAVAKWNGLEDADDPTNVGISTDDLLSPNDLGRAW